MTMHDVAGQSGADNQSIRPALRVATRAGVPDCFIAHAQPDQDVLVALPGGTGSAADIAADFAAHPDFAGMTIIAPVLSEDRFGAYQQLELSASGQTRADAGLIGLLDELAESEGLATRAVRLFGFSDGAQLAHRFAMLHPGRVTALCVVSAEWYCMPRPDLAWPYGIGDGAGAPLVAPDFLDLPTTVIVGNRDTRVDAGVRQDPAILDHQGRNRLRRARCYVRALCAYAEAVGKRGRPQLLALHGVSADFAQSVTGADLITIAARALLDRNLSSNGPIAALH